MSASSLIPSYKLYGDTEDWPLPELLHCESISERSVLHDWTIRPHRHHDLFQMLCCGRGTVRLVLDGTRETLSSPYLVTVPPMHVHGFEFDHGAEGWVVTLPTFALKRLIGHDVGFLERFDRPHILNLGETEEGVSIGTMFERLAGEFLGARPARLIALEASLSLILVAIVRAVISRREGGSRGAERGAQRMRHFQELIEKSFRNWMPIQTYAAELGVTPAQLNNTCRTLAGRSALQIVHGRLLIEAKRNLVYTEMTISEVAYSLGFSDPAYFTRFFKKRVGQSPSTFRSARRRTPVS